MALIYCPECGHEISNSAIACPSCGRPINAPAPVIEPVVVTKHPHPREGFPLWAIAPLAILGVTVLFLLFYMMGRDDDSAESNLNINVNARRAGASRTDDRDTARTSDVSTTTVPPSSTTVIPPSGSSTSSVPSDSQTVNVPGSQTAVPAELTRGRVVIDAKIATRTGSTQAVRNERFYLLDKDLESILSEADLEPVEGNTMANSFGLAVMYPNRFGDFHRKAMAAIKPHIKYSGTTDGSGKAALSNIEPDSYYLFGISKTGNGFALWSSPVSIRAGENVLNLSPQRVTEMDNYSGFDREAFADQDGE